MEAAPAVALPEPIREPVQAVTTLFSEYGHAMRQAVHGHDSTIDGDVQHQRFTHPRQPEREVNNTFQTEFDNSPAVSLADCQHKVQAQLRQNSIRDTDVAAEVERTSSKIVVPDSTRNVYLRLDYISERDSRAALLCVVASVILGTGALITEFTKKLQLGLQPYTFRHSVIYRWNISVSTIGLFLLTFSLGALLYQTLVALLFRKSWTHRRKRIVILFLIEGFAQWVNLVFYLVPNVNLILRPCELFSPLTLWAGFVRWSCWNTIFMLFLIHAYSTCTWKDTARSNSNQVTTPRRGGQCNTRLIMDGPWKLLWPCLLIWPINEAVLGFAWIHNTTGASDADEYCKRGGESTSCDIDRATQIAVILAVVMAGLYFTVTYVLLFRKLAGYKKLAYTAVQNAIVFNTLQLWLRVIVMSFFMACLVLMWLVNSTWCSSFSFSWLGLMPMQIVMTVNIVVLCFISTPTKPSEQAAASQVWLQEFAWTESDKPIKAAARLAMLPDNSELQQQPIFCFQTMLNLLYWSCLVYDHEREQTRIKSLSKKTLPEPQSASPTFAARTTLTLDGALGLYSMTDSESFWEIKQDTRCLIGWGNHTVVVAFRGTASMRNALADMQAWRIAHPPTRGQTFMGSRPLVHVGFLKSWLAGGLNAQVIKRVTEAVKQCKGQTSSSGKIMVYVTGHSLGGALATLAAWDIRKHLLDLKHSDVEVVCYTFAAPRTGNHAFAREYNALVPDTWSIINDQDVVTREGKLVFMYKRPGQRVIVNAAGHMMVRPTHIEASVQRSTGGQSVKHHLLSNYYHAILAVVLAQFSNRGFIDGMAGIVRLAEASSYFQELLDSQMGMSLDKMRQHMTANSSAREDQAPPLPSLPGAHLPIKGFYFTKNLLATASSINFGTPTKTSSGRFFKPARASPVLETASQDSAAVSMQTAVSDVDGA